MNKAGLAPAIDESEWARLVEIECRLEAEIVAAQADAAARVAAARAQAAAADPAALAALAADDERADTERHRAELARLDAEADEWLQRLAAVPNERIDNLARWLLEAALADAPAPEAP